MQKYFVSYIEQKYSGISSKFFKNIEISINSELLKDSTLLNILNDEIINEISSDKFTILNFIKL